MNQEKKSISQYEPGPEVKAFIFQQIQDLEPMLENVGSLGVFIERSKDDKKAKSKSRAQKKKVEAETYLIRLVVAPGGIRIEVEGVSTNIYDACIKAKDLMIQKLAPLINATRQSPERDVLVQFYSEGGQIH